MAYSNSQKKQHIYELQKYLHAISLMNHNIPSVIPDGIYGDETTIAVKAFQREYGLRDTGNTNPETWSRIINVYKSFLRASPLPFNIFPSEKYVLSEGDSGFVVYVVQAALNELCNRYDNVPFTEVTGKFTKQTADSVADFQKWSGLPVSGNVDSATWNLLVRCCEHNQ